MPELSLRRSGKNKFVSDEVEVRHSPEVGRHVVAVEDIEAMELGSEDGLAMLPMLKALVNTRKYVKEGQWMDVINQTCSSVDIQQWENSHLALQSRIRDASGNLIQDTG